MDDLSLPEVREEDLDGLAPQQMADQDFDPTGALDLLQTMVET